MPHSRRQLLANGVIAASRVAAFMMRPTTTPSGGHVEIVIAPLAGQAGIR